jgi:DNA repair protein RecO (recombination protein O)
LDWRDEGIVISARRHGETSAILEAFTAGHGRHAGVVRGGASRRWMPILQPGARLSLEWSARLETHIGTFRADPIDTPLARVLSDRAALAALGSVTALIGAAMPERAPHPRLYEATRALTAALGEGDPHWRARYVLWELQMLRELGFGLDLATCAATGACEDLVWVSPRSGRAVSGAAGAAWADRLLPLPAFLRDGRAEADRAAIALALALTGHFLEARLAPTLAREALPLARARGVAAMLRE